MQNLIASVTKDQLRTDHPSFRAGDTVTVDVKVVERTRERIQALEGIVTRPQNGGIHETFTARKLSYGVGIERTLPLHSPRIDSIKVKRRGKVRRAKLYHRRNLHGIEARINERL